MLHTFVVHVEDKPGVLTRVASVFRRRCFNIDSLSVGRTQKPAVSRMTIAADMDADQAYRIEANLCKLENVLKVEDLTGEAALIRDFAMVRVAVTAESRSRLLKLARLFHSRVVENCPDSLTLEITDGPDKIDALVRALRPVGILEMARAGNVALRRHDYASPHHPRTEAPTPQPRRASS